jgi:hypothetical protein
MVYNYTLKIRTFGGDPYATGNKLATDNKYEYSINSNNRRTGNMHGCQVNRSTYGLHHNLDKRAIEKQIQKTVRVSSSEYLMNKVSLNVGEARKGVVGQVTNNWWNQSSDRAVQSIETAVVPTRGSSTRSSITRLRPGSMRPGGKGVDVKHNSYDRYLARLKGRKVLRQDPYPNPLPANTDTNDINGIKFNIVSGCPC